MTNIDLQKPVFNSRRMEQQWSRIQGVKMVQSGFTIQQTADFLGVSYRAVRNWLLAFDKSGQNGLLAKHGAGRPVKLTDKQMRWIATTVRDNTPDQLRFEFGLWTRYLIGELIKREWGLRLSLTTLGKIMTRLGFTSQGPLRSAYEQNPALVQNWLEVQLPVLRARAKRKGARIFFADEASMDGAGTIWAPQENETGGPGGGSVNMILALSNLGQLQFMLVEDSGTAQVFKQFLEQLMLGARQPIILVADGHGMHKAHVVNEYVASTDGMLELYYLAPYSSPLNSDWQT